MGKSEQDLLKEFSPEFMANGLSGMLKSGEYEAVDVKFTFYRKAPPREVPSKKSETEILPIALGCPCVGCKIGSIEICRKCVEEHLQKRSNHATMDG